MKDDGTIDNLVDRVEAAYILGIHDRTVPRLAKNGLLETIKQGRLHKYRLEDVNFLKQKFDARSELNGYIKEIYVMNQCGLLNWQIMEEFQIDEERKITGALQIYRGERQRYLKKFEIPDGEHEFLLLAEETCVRLKIVDKHVIYDLISNGNLDAKTVNWNGKDRYFVRLQSLMDFLGHYSDKRLYKSDHVAELLGKSRKYIDRVANDHAIGFKIKNTKQGIYLFTSAEITRMRNLKRKK